MIPCATCHRAPPQSGGAHRTREECAAARKASCAAPEQHHPYAPDLSYVRGIVEHAATLATEGHPEAIEAIRAALARFDADALNETEETP